MRIAIIGAGIAGLTAAWLLDEDHDVTVYEATGGPGGNIRTISVPTGQGKIVAIDLGAQMLSPRPTPATPPCAEHWTSPTPTPPRSP